MLDTNLRPQLLETMYTLLPRVLQRDIPEVSEHTTLMADLGLTSSTTLELLLELEDALDIQINVEDIAEDDVTDLGTLVTYIAGHLITDE